MSNSTAYERMQIYKAKHCTKECDASEKKRQAHVAIKALSGFKSHSRQNLIKEYNIIRKGDINE